MFKMSNAEREIFYIFIWLIGIILFYTLIDTFLLSVSKNEEASTQKHLFVGTISPKDKVSNKSSTQMVNLIQDTHIQEIQRVAIVTKEDTNHIKKIQEAKVKAIVPVIVKTSIPKDMKINTKPEIKIEKVSQIIKKETKIKIPILAINNTDNQILENTIKKEFDRDKEISARQKLIKEIIEARNYTIRELNR